MAESIRVKLPDGSVKEVSKGTTALDVAESISPRLADAALVAKTNGDLIDLTKPLEKDTDLRLLTDKDPEALEVYRHSSAHLLAAAVLELFPETKLGHGPPTESGFFYDFYRPTPFTPEDLEKIEKKMQELVQQNIPYAREFLPREQGLAAFKKEGDFMKCHFIEQFTKPDEKISIYRTGKFTDFCRGPHIPSTGKIKAFKLFNIAGAYWLGDEKNPQLQRIYGTSFFSKKELDEYLRRLEEAKKRDHRVLGQQLDLFSCFRVRLCSLRRVYIGQPRGLGREGLQRARTGSVSGQGIAEIGRAIPSGSRQELRLDAPRCRGRAAVRWRAARDSTRPGSGSRRDVPPRCGR